MRQVLQHPLEAEVRLAVVACREVFVGPNYLDSELFVEHLLGNGLGEVGLVGIVSELLESQLYFLVDEVVVVTDELGVDQLL